MLRTTLTRNARLFTTSTRYYKGPVEMGKDALKAVDRTISDAAVKGIETGEKVAETVKQTAGKSTGELKGDAHEMAGQAKGKAQEVSGQAQGKAQELKGQASGKASELKGEAKAKMD